MCVCTRVPIPHESSSYIRVCLCETVESVYLCVCKRACVTGAGGTSHPVPWMLKYVPVWCEYM